jgi:hypothetical protein
LFKLEHKRKYERGLTEEEVAEEAHRMARVDTVIHGAEGTARKQLAKLEDLAKFARRNGQRLRPRATDDLRLLRLLYWAPSIFAENPELTPDHPFSEAKPANDGNIYPYNSKIRPPPLWIDEDGVQIADQPKIFRSHPHYWPYSGFVPPAVEPENFVPAVSREEAESSHDRGDAPDPPSASNPCEQPVPIPAPSSK